MPNDLFITFSLGSSENSYIGWISTNWGVRFIRLGDVCGNLSRSKLFFTVHLHFYFTYRHVDTERSRLTKNDILAPKLTKYKTYFSHTRSRIREQCCTENRKLVVEIWRSFCACSERTRAHEPLQLIKGSVYGIDSGFGEKGRNLEC